MSKWNRLLAAAFAIALVVSAPAAQAKVRRDTTMTGAVMLSPTFPFTCDADESYGRRVSDADGLWRCRWPLAGG